MSLLKRLFKAPAPDLQTQIQALDNCATDQLMDICLGSESEALREAAIGRLPYTQTLRDLATDSQSSRMRTAARKRVGQLLDEGQLELAQLGRDLNDDHLLLAVCGYSPAASLRALEQISDPAILLQLATDGATTQMRQAAAEKLANRNQLEQLLKAAQGKDKNVYRLAKTRLDSFKAEDARLAEVSRKAAELCTKMESLSRLESDPLFNARLANLNAEWAALAQDVAPELEQRYNKAQTHCQQTIDRQEHAQAAEKQQAAQASQASQTLNTALAAIKGLIGEFYGCTDKAALDSGNYPQQLHNLKASVNAARDMSGGAISSAGFDTLHQSAGMLLEQLQSVGTLSALTTALSNSNDSAAQAATADTLKQLLQAAEVIPEQQRPAELQAAQAALDAWWDQQQRKDRQQKDALRQINELCRRGLSAAEQGQVRKARGIHKELLEKIQPLPPLSENLQTRVDDLDAAIEKLSDWHDFAVTPKKHELIAQMQSLAGSSMPPADLAERIHLLQEDWKALSRGVQQQDEDLWQAFQKASHIAYEPCKEFFEAQAAEREQNLAHRAQLIEQVRTYLHNYDWENVIWKDVEQTLKVARQEWQSYWPVPRKASADLQKTFDNLMDELHGKLTTEYQANKEKKAALVGQAHGLLDLEDLHQSTEQAKLLQNQWKLVGRTWARDEQALWKSFRKVCDDIFARRKAEHNAARSERAEQEQQAEALLKKLAALAEASGQGLIDARGQAAEIRTKFEQVGELPHASAKRLKARLHDGLKAINDKLSSERKAAEQSSWDALLDASNRVRDAELAVLASKRESALTEARSALEQVTLWPQGSRELLEQRLKAAPALTGEHQSQSQEALHLLCIRAEILSGIETPAEDKGRRMAYQVEQLQQGLGRREESIEALILEWVTHGAVPTKAYQVLLQRLNHCRQKI
jgi:hypothetical protein